nr:protein FAM207A [Ictidomys tridecemlineatus]
MPLGKEVSDWPDQGIPEASPALRLSPTGKTAALVARCSTVLVPESRDPASGDPRLPDATAPRRPARQRERSSALREQEQEEGGRERARDDRAFMSSLQSVEVAGTEERGTALQGTELSPGWRGPARQPLRVTESQGGEPEVLQGEPRDRSALCVQGSCAAEACSVFLITPAGGAAHWADCPGRQSAGLLPVRSGTAATKRRQIFKRPLKEALSRLTPGRTPPDQQSGQDWAFIHTDIFAKTQIDPSALVQSLELDQRSLASLRKGAEAKAILPKKEKLRLRRERWLQKIEAIKLAEQKLKEERRRRATAVVGDLHPLRDALPELQELEAGRRQQTRGRVSSKPRPAELSRMSAAQRRQLLEEERTRFQELLTSPAYRASPLLAIGQQLAHQMQLEGGSQL